VNQPPDTVSPPPIPPQAPDAWPTWEQGFRADHAPCGVCAPSPWVHGAQPPPRLTAASQPVWPALEDDLGQLPRTVAPDRLLAQLATRVALGRAKYGVELHTHDGRDPWLDANEEILDLLQYLARLALAGHLPPDTYRYLLTLTTTLWAGLDHAQRREPIPAPDAAEGLW